MSYKAAINHSAETYRQLCKIQQQVFFKRQEMLCLLIGATLVLLSLSIGNTTVSLFVLFIGCWFIAGMKTPPLRRAKKMVEAVKDNFPCTLYHFDESYFLASNQFGSLKGGYKDISRLVEDRKYYYLFLENQSGHMIDKASLADEDKESFPAFLQERTGLVLENASSYGSISYMINALRRSEK